MNQPIQENKEKCCEFCLECPDYTEHNFCHDKECKCHIPQPKEVQNTSREEIRERWRKYVASEVEVSPTKLLIWWLAEIEAAEKRGQEAERERVREQAEKYWYSFCSAHKVTDPECNTCKHGSFDFAEFLSALEPKS